MPRSLKDQVVLISGASSGFGADAARLFAREGCIVVLAARRLDRLTALADEIKAGGGQAFPLQMDVTRQADIDSGVQAVLGRYGRIDVHFNNAGLGRLDWFEKLDPITDLDTQLSVNLRGLIQLTRAVIPSMLARRSGTIINMSSIAGLIAAPTYTLYAATKFGIRGFSDALRREVSPFGLYVSVIYPGPAHTEFSQHSGEATVSKSIHLPGWLYMTSEYVARRTVDLAYRPRRRLVIPWYYRPIIALETLFPALVDWLVKVLYVKKFHKFD